MALLYPSPDLYPGTGVYPTDWQPLGLPAATEVLRRNQVRVLYGEFKTGRVTGVLPATSVSWSAEQNAAGSISNVSVPEDVARDLDLRQATHGWRNFLAVERDGRIVQAGPITSRTFDWQSGAVTLGAAGIWAWMDHVFIRPAGVVFPYQKFTYTLSGKTLGGIARGLVARLLASGFTGVPIVLPADEAGDRTESWPVWQLSTYGEQLRQITQRAVNAPDIRFAPRRKAGDPRFLEWVMQVGTATAPALSQAGPDWVFDTTVARSPVLGISTDEDATSMAQQVWVTGNGMEEDQLMALRYDDTLLKLGWPLTEAEENHATVEEQDTLRGHADNLLARSARPIEVWRVTVKADAAREVMPGDYCQVITRGDVWVPDGQRRMRVQKISGDLGDTLTLDMYPMAGVL